MESYLIVYGVKTQPLLLKISTPVTVYGNLRQRTVSEKFLTRLPIQKLNASRQL